MEGKCCIFASSASEDTPRRAQAMRWIGEMKISFQRAIRFPATQTRRSELRKATSVLDQTTHLCNSGDCAPKPAKQGECFQFSNDLGVKEIRVGVRAFECIGETPPQDHPHVYLELGEHNQILCPYCSTLFRFDTGLRNV